MASNEPLRITPSFLNFPPPLNRVITNILKLQNTTNNFVAYKVKTTAPKRYCVRPNLGLISPGDTVEVQVLLNYIKDPPTNLECKDRFQVQSIVLDDASKQKVNLKDLFVNTAQERIIKQRLKCRFAPVSKPKATIETPDLEKEALPSGPSEVQATGAASDVVSTSPAPEPSPQAASEATTAAEPSKPSFKANTSTSSDLHRRRLSSDAVTQAGSTKVQPSKPAFMATSSASTRAEPPSTQSNMRWIIQLVIVALICFLVGKWLG